MFEFPPIVPCKVPYCNHVGGNLRYLKYKNKFTVVVDNSPLRHPRFLTSPWQYERAHGSVRKRGLGIGWYFKYLGCAWELVLTKTPDTINVLFENGLC